MLMQAMSSLYMGKQLTPTERDILAKYMHNMTDIMLKDDTVFNRTKLHTQRTKYQTEETTVDLDEKMVDGVEILDGPEDENKKMKMKKEKDMKESREGDEEERMRKKEENKARRLSIRKRDKFRMLPTELKKEKMKAGVEEEVINFNDMYKEQFEAALEYYGIDNIRDLPEEKKAEFFKIVDVALEEAKMAKKDYDGDGKIETSTAEYMGSRDKAIKKAMKKEEVEVEEGYYKDMDTKKKEDDRLAKKPAAIKLRGFGPDAGKSNMSNPAARASLMKKEEVEIEEENKEKISAYQASVLRHEKKRDAAAKKAKEKGPTRASKRDPEGPFKMGSQTGHGSKPGHAPLKNYNGEVITSKDRANAAARKKIEDKKMAPKNPAATPDRLAMIRRAADRVQSGAAAKDAEKRAKADMKQKGAQKGMAPTKKDVKEQVAAIRKVIKEGSTKEKIEAYKELNTIIEQFKTTGEL